MDIRDIREIMGLTQAQVADELGVPRQEVIDCEENGYSGTDMVISHCLNEPMTRTLRDMIRSRWAEASVQVLPTRGLDSYYAERSGLIISYPASV